MVYETILKGISKGSLSRYVSVVFTSDAKRDIYKDFDRILGFLSGTDYFYVIIFRNGKRHVHMVIRDCPFYKYQLKEIWFWIHNASKFDFEGVKDAVSIAVYFATQEDIDFVSCSGEWL